MNEASAPLSSQAGSLLLLTGIFFLNFSSRIILAPLMPTIENDLKLGHGEAGSLFLMISLGYFVGLMGSGVFSSRFTHRKTIIFSSITIGGALLVVSLTSRMWGIFFGLIMLGMTAGLYLPSGITTLTSLVRFEDWGKAIAIHEMAPNFSYMAAPIAAEILLRWFSWRCIVTLFGVATVLFGLTFARFGKGGGFPGESPRHETVRMLLDEPSFWIMVVFFSLGVGGTLGVYAMLPLYLVSERGMPRAWVNYLVGLSRASGLGAAFLSGIITDRLGPKIALGAVFLLSGLLTMLIGVVPGSWVMLAVFLQPVLAVCFFPPGFAALSRIGPPKMRNISVSFTVPLGFLLGGGAIPAGIGILGDRELFGLGMSLAGVIIIGGFFLLPYLKFPDNRM